ncbi:glycosylphosphatidylinositol-anchored lipid protein transfer 5 [Hibiscus trionum]|uniref:Glycosylphosphatidylinositol-anchored lipid protein transfer 5 n=1 Tax=Hibiscus trionum TaxID=183268 RepID=A0A9W7IIN6_HIBTR|nr:glycosylphosphatidylinositol-anchored lipid protein transfer 5 [Hibiscus trionum]
MKMATCFVLVLVAMLSAGAEAQSGCTNVLISMSPCLNYITGNSSTPSGQCCSQLASVVRSSPQCLCEVLNGGGSSLGITINRTQALALPGSCNVQTPPISNCNAASPMPADSPVGSPESGSIVPTEGGSKTVPSGEGDGSSSSNGSAATTTTKLSFSLLVFLVVVATFIQ